MDESARNGRVRPLALHREPGEAGAEFMESADAWAYDKVRGRRGTDGGLARL